LRHLKSTFTAIGAAGLLLIAAIGLNITFTANSAPSAPAQDPTIDAAVQAALTATAGADPDFDATVAAALEATLTATFQPPTPTPIPTNTPGPVNDGDDDTTDLTALTADTVARLNLVTVFAPDETDNEAVSAADIRGNLVASNVFETVYLWDATTGDVQATMEHDAVVSSLHFNPAAPELISIDENGQVYRWDIETGDALPVAEQAETSEQPVIVGFAESGEQFAVYTFDGTLTLWEYPDVAPAQSRDELNFALLEFDSNIAAYTYPDAPAELQIVRGEETFVATLPDDVGFIEPVDFNADGSRLIVTTDTASNYVLDTATGDTLYAFERSGLGLTKFNPAGTLIAGVLDDGNVRLWDAETGEVLTTRDGGDATGIEVAFSEDGAFFVSFSEDGAVRVWDGGGDEAPTETVDSGPTPLPEGFPPITEADVQVAEQVFENGRMFWVQPVNQLWVMVLTDEGRGQWLVYPDNFDEDVDPATDPALEAPEGFIQPERGFGKLWRENPEVRETLGWAITPEFGYVSNYRYVPGGEMVDGDYVPGPGYHILFSLDGEQFRFNEETGTWQLGE